MKEVHFVTKPTTRSASNTAAKTTVQKPTLVVAAIDVQDEDECAIISVDDNEVTLNEGEISTLFQDTSTDDKGYEEWLQLHLNALKLNHPSVRSHNYYAH